MFYCFWIVFWWHCIYEKRFNQSYNWLNIILYKILIFLHFIWIVLIVWKILKVWKVLTSWNAHNVWNKLQNFVRQVQHTYVIFFSFSSFLLIHKQCIIIIYFYKLLKTYLTISCVINFHSPSFVEKRACIYLAPGSPCYYSNKK